MSNGNGNGNINRTIIHAVAGLGIATFACVVLILALAPSQAAQIPGLLVASAAVNVGLFNMKKIYKNDETTNVVLSKVDSVNRRVEGVTEKVENVEAQGLENQKVLDGNLKRFFANTESALMELRVELDKRQQLGQAQGERKGREETEARLSGSGINIRQDPDDSP